jgi:hypothetical protein
VFAFIISKNNENKALQLMPNWIHSGLLRKAAPHGGEVNMESDTPYSRSTVPLPQLKKR